MDTQDEQSGDPTQNQGTQLNESSDAILVPGSDDDANESIGNTGGGNGGSSGTTSAISSPFIDVGPPEDPPTESERKDMNNRQ